MNDVGEERKKKSEGRVVVKVLMNFLIAIVGENVNSWRFVGSSCLLLLLWLSLFISISC